MTMSQDDQQDIRNDRARPETESHSKLVPIVGIGASAGGIEALSHFFRAVPQDSGLAYVVIQHLDPHSESHMAEVISRFARMPVVVAEEGMAPEPNTVYVIPPNTYLAMAKDRMRLHEPVKQHGLRLPIDHFFRSLAEARRERAICVILSGGGSDGSLGLRDVRGAGGIVIVQDPDEADSDSMPLSAISTGEVDAVLPVHQMPETILTYVKRLGAEDSGAEDSGAEDSGAEDSGAEDSGAEDSGAEDSDGARAGGGIVHGDEHHLGIILQLLISRGGNDFRPYKRATIRRRVQRRMGLNGITTLAEYARFVRDNPDEIARLSRDLLIGVTSFFRDPEAYAALREKALVPLIKGKGPDDPLRVWVAGCASGEEAYSIAILLLEEMDAAEKNGPVKVFATDIDQEALETARAGVYPENIALDVSEERLARFFVREGQTYHIGRQVREAVVFAPHNLLSDPPFSRLDLVSCRNVLIYLEGDVQRQVISLFAFALRPGGMLFLGKSDGSADHTGTFTAVSSRWRIYRRSATPSRLNMGLREPNRAAMWPPTEPTEHLPAGHPPARLSDLNQRVLLAHFDASVILVDRSGQILHFFGPTSRYLDLPSGTPNLNLLHMARRPLADKLRGALRQAAQNSEAVELRHIQIAESGDRALVNVTVRPIESHAGDEPLLAVIFEEAARLPADARGGSATDDHAGDGDLRIDQRLIDELESELSLTRTNLQVTIEELETSNEELKSANEEVMSMNEELQSTNEELISSKEELQSLNEELSTVNLQLKEKVSELSEANSDLDNLLRSTDMATLFLDSELRIKRFSPRTTDLLNLIPTDVGRPIQHITPRYEGVDLAADATAVLRDLGTLERDVHTRDDRWFTMRVLPYRTLEQKIGGVVVTFADNTQLMKTKMSLQDAVIYAESIVETVSEPLVVLDGELRVVSANPAFYRQFALKPQEIEMRPIYDLGNGEWNIPALRELLENIIPRNSRFSDFNVERDFSRIGPRTIRLNAGRIEQRGKRADLILLAMEDVTQRLHNERAIADLNQRLTVANSNLESFAYSVSHDLRTPLRAMSGFSQALLEDYGPQLDDQAEDYLQRIRAAGERMGGLIDSLLDLSRISRSKMRRERVELGALARTIADSLQREEPQRHIEWVIHEELEVDGDPTLLQVALDNLIGNAFKFTRPHERARIEFGAEQQEGQTVYYVRDDGVGFDAEHAGRLFGVFQRLHSKDEFEGTGIGLATVQRIIERHGGRIWAEGEPESGATFYFTL
jgi:two-component system CheB/CheR fusion protein